MQKLWSSRSKRSQPLEEPDQPSSVNNCSENGSDELPESAAISIDDEAPNSSITSTNKSTKSLSYRWTKLLPRFGQFSQNHKSQDTANNEANSSASNFDWQVSAAWLLFALGIGGVVVVAFLGLQYLTAPESTPDSSLACRNKLAGDWQTPLGKITIEEKSGDQVSAKYEYANFERGKISGEFTGKLKNNVLIFDWKENPQLPTQQQGKGVLVFAEGCKEFYGSYGTGDSTNNFGNWQGSRMSK